MNRAAERTDAIRPTTDKRILTGLQGGRAVAAIMVAVFHANVFLLPTNFYAGAGAGKIFNFGYAGVEFFFVLSGFIMVLVHRRDFGRPAQAGAFLRKRILRIYPIYWLVLGFVIAIYFMSPGRGPEHARDPSAILTSLLLWPTPEGPIMQVAWTLQHEMLFYLVFMLLIINLRVGLVIFGLWMAACILALPRYSSIDFPADFVLKPHNLLFVFGIAAAIAYGRFSVTQARTSFWFGTVLFLGLGLGETVGGVTLPPAFLTLGYGLGATMAVIGLAGGNLPAPRWLALLGDASYAIYLVHLPAMNILAVGLRAAGVHQFLPPLAMLVLITVLVTGIGILVHLIVEKPVTASLGNRRQAKPAA